MAPASAPAPCPPTPPPERAALPEAAGPALREADADAEGELLEEDEVEGEPLVGNGVDDPFEPVDAEEDPLAADLTAEAPTTEDGAVAGCPDLVELGVADLSVADLPLPDFSPLVASGSPFLTASLDEALPDEAFGADEAGVAGAAPVGLTGVVEAVLGADAPAEGDTASAGDATERDAPVDPAAGIEADEPAALGAALADAAALLPAAFAASVVFIVVVLPATDDVGGEEDLDASDLAAEPGAEDEYFTSVRPLDVPAASLDGEPVDPAAFDAVETTFVALSSDRPVASLPVVLVLSPSVTVSIFSALRSMVWPRVLFGLDRLGRLVIASAPFLPPHARLANAGYRRRVRAACAPLLFVLHSRWSRKHRTAE